MVVGNNQMKDQTSINITNFQVIFLHVTSGQKSHPALAILFIGIIRSIMGTFKALLTMIE